MQLELSTQRIWLLSSLGLFLLLITLLLPSNLVNASCGSIIYQEVEWDYENNKEIEVEIKESINNCDNPFNEENGEPFEYNISLNSQNVEKGIVLVIEEDEPLSVSYSVSGASRDSIVELDLYKKEESDYRRVYSSYANWVSNNDSLKEGEYVAVIIYEEMPPLILMSSNTTPSWLEQLKNFFLPQTTHAFYEDSQQVVAVNFTVEYEEEEELIDPLLLQFAPILYMHPDETYFPMNVESFIEDSALWNQSGTDEQLKTAEDLTVTEFEDIIKAEDTEGYYLAYSDPGNSGSIDLGKAKSKYEEAVENGSATTTVYAHKMTDSYKDSQGKRHHFTVLQYWFFYAMNNWGEVGGFNDHEGDWESVFVFLDNEKDVPAYVAYSSHHNDGFAEFYNVGQYESVRRGWNEVEREGNRVNSYVSEGSHANYSDTGENDYHIVPFLDPFVAFKDKVSKEGFVIKDFSLKEVLLDKQVHDYEGKWGIDKILPGGDGPRGPLFTDVGGTKRFENPIEWAEIDKIEKIVLEESKSQFDVSTIVFNFSEAVPVGTELSVDEHNEVVVFGVVSEDTELLPIFWDIESSLEDNTFEATVSLPYNPDLVRGLDYREEDLRAMYYDPETVTWEIVKSEVDIENHLVLFKTNHFSRYGIGAVESEPVVLEGITSSTTDSVELEKSNEKSKSSGTRVGSRQKTNVVGEVAGVSTNPSLVSSTELQKMYQILLKIKEIINAYKLNNL